MLKSDNYNLFVIKTLASKIDICKSLNMKSFLIVFTFFYFALPCYSQTLVGIKKVIIIKHVTDDLNSLNIVPSTNYIKEQLVKDISNIDIVSSIEINVFENASIVFAYDIFKNYKTTTDEQYYGAIIIKVNRDIVDSRFNTTLLSADVYTDAVYVLVNNPDLDVFKIELLEQTNKLIRNLAYYYYYQNNSK